jgi:hypothetical protein
VGIGLGELDGSIDGRDGRALGTTVGLRVGE